MERTGRGPELAEVPPGYCLNGHALRPPNVQVLWLGCSCAASRGHRGWRCCTCGEVVYEPPHTDRAQESAYRPR
jgi:hypothetical protein